jgi:hypothetical protein
MVRFWLANRASSDRIETEFLGARLALIEQVAMQAGLERFSYYGEEETVFWFEGTLGQVVMAVQELGEQWGLEHLGVEVSSRDLADKWPSAVKVGSLAVGEAEVPGKGDRRLRTGRRHEEPAVPEPDLESTLKRAFIPQGSDWP